MELRVECDCDPAGGLDLAVIWFGSRRVPVLSVIDRWWGNGMQWWKVDAADGLYILRRDQDSRLWELAAAPRR